jgi:ABC-type sugar transport system ATPase subunit
MIRIENHVKQYGDVVAVKGICLDVKVGEISALRLHRCVRMFKPSR